MAILSRSVDAAAGRGQLEHLHQGGGQHQQHGPEVALHHELAGHASTGRHCCSAKNLTLTLLVEFPFKDKSLKKVYNDGINHTTV